MLSFSFQNCTVSYRLQGKGKTVVLLHGFGEDGHIWDEQIGFLEQYCQLLVPDLPGSGKSAVWHPGNHSKQDDIMIDDYATVIHALLKHEGISCCTMIGHSMGGYITLAFAEKFPDTLDGFGLVNSTAFADSEEKKQTRARAIEAIRAYGAWPFLKTTIPTLFSDAFRERHPEKIAELIEAGRNFSGEALQQYYHAMMNRPDRTHVLKSNPLPVLFVTGTEDAPAPMRDVLQQVHLPYKSYIHVLEGIGHMSMWEATDILNRLLLAFINRS